MLKQTETETLEKEQQCLENMLNKKELEEEAKAEEEVKEEGKEEVNGVLKDAFELIKDTKKNETLALQAQHKDYLNEQDE